MLSWTPVLFWIMEIKAYAKINLTLEVLGRRPDGYHEVRTVLQTIDLADTLWITPSRELEVCCDAPGLGGEDNLVWRAAEELRRATGCRKGARVYLEKHIPIGAGLGGGSSDAACALKALLQHWRLELDSESVRSIAASVGSDVPFFLHGGTALGEGRGDEVVRLSSLPETWMVLFCPPSVSPNPAGKTAHLYSMLTPEHYTDGGYTQRFVDSARHGDRWQEKLFNVFEPLAAATFDGYRDAGKRLLEAGAGRVNLSGTGPAFYSFTSDKEAAHRLMDSLQETGSKAYALRTYDPGN